ncbi:MAG TPA: hypothetical protein VNP92_14460, partial [Actinophytocola sp.]|nr:hypothetical protein [Actinophytocola sp.]
MIVDAHVTLGSDRVIPPRFIEEQAANVHHRLTCHGQRVSQDRVLRRVRALYDDHDGDRLVSEMDAAGVDRAYLVAADFSRVTEDATAPADLAAHHHRVRLRHPGR